jgi:hypothetical protein
MLAIIKVTTKLKQVKIQISADSILKLTNLLNLKKFYFRKIGARNLKGINMSQNLGASKLKGINMTVKIWEQVN